MRTCDICRYTKRYPTENVSIHSFPKNEQMRQLWIAAIGQKNYKPTKSSALCSQHFKDNCFFYPLGGEKKKRHIKPDAVPTIFGFHYSRGKASENGNIKQIKIVTEATSNTIDNAPVEHIEECIVIKEEIIDETLSPSNDNVENNDDNVENNDDNVENNDDNVENNDDNVENNQSYMENIHDNSNTNSCNKRDPQMNVELFGSPFKKYQRRWKPRYFGDCTEKDLESPIKAKRTWEIIKRTVNDQKRKISRLQRQVERQKKKITDMKTYIAQLKEKQKISNQAEKNISVSDHGIMGHFLL